MTASDLIRRPITIADKPFLYRLYATSRAEEMALVPWSAGQKAAFLQQQFEAQYTDYYRRFPDASYLLLLTAEQPIGRLYVDDRPEEIGLMEISLLPEWRGRGLGTVLVRELMETARAAGKPVRLYVERFNPAKRLYDRLGFVALGEHGPYMHMEWSAG
jgi:ribosomal protein S18 acetylase RimI-like enzyme